MPCSIFEIDIHYTNRIISTPFLNPTGVFRASTGFVATFGRVQYSPYGPVLWLNLDPTLGRAYNDTIITGGKR